MGRVDPQESFGAMYGRLRNIAARLINKESPTHTLRPTELVHEAFLRLREWRDQHPGQEDETKFVTLSARTMRRILVDHARQASRRKPNGSYHATHIHGTAIAGGDAVIDIVALDQALQQLGELSPRQAQIVELRVFANMTIEEVAAELGVVASTVSLDWRHARAWIANHLDLYRE